VVLGRIPDLMHALGYYPSEQEARHMCAEVKYAEFTATGETAEDIGLDDFVRLYVNHRPLVGVGKDDIQAAFAALEAMGLGAANAGAAGLGSGAVDWAALAGRLQSEGEPMTAGQLKGCLNALIGADQTLAGLIDADSFSGNVLGFEEGGDDAAEEE
jgi:hypothetical protein